MTAVFSIGRFAAGFVVALAWSGHALADPTAGPPAPNCAVPPQLSAIEAALDHTALRIHLGKPLTIVAIGSSSTLGVGASAPAMNYPSLLEQELRERFPGVEIRVINHGIGGQDVPEELTRLDRDVMAEQQYAPRVLARPAFAEMERLLAELAKRARVGLFRRFEIMKEWDRTRQLAPAEMIGPDGLHMTDASYGCLANRLAEALTSNWRSHEKLAKSPHRSPVTIAGVERPRGTQPAAASQLH